MLVLVPQVGLLTKRKSPSAGPSSQVHQIRGGFLHSLVIIFLTMWHMQEIPEKSELFFLEILAGSVDLPFTIVYWRQRFRDQVWPALITISTGLGSLIMMYLCLCWVAVE